MREIIGTFFEDELVKYIPSDTYPIEVKIQIGLIYQPNFEKFEKHI